MFRRLKKLFQWGTRFKIGNGCDISFWDDVWTGDFPLKIKYNLLFKICHSPYMSVAEGVIGDSWNITFRRTLGAEEADQWEDLKKLY